jgi:quinolinate synthase
VERAIVTRTSSSARAGAEIARQFPDAKVVVHPESLREVRDLADAVCSTEKMISYCKTSPAKRFVIVTESGIIHRMQKECPGKEFLCAPTFDVMRLPTDTAVAASANT